MSQEERKEEEDHITGRKKSGRSGGGSMESFNLTSNKLRSLRYNKQTQ